MKRTIVTLSFTCLLAGCGDAGSVKSEQVNAPAPAATSTPAPVAPAQEQPKVPYEDLLASGDEFLKEGKLNDAARVLTQAIKQEPQRPDAYIRRAAVLADAKHLVPAVNDMSVAIQLEADNPKLLNTRGYFLLLLKEYDRADADFSASISLDLQYPQPYNNRGLIAIARGEYKQSLVDFDNALRVKADYIDAINNRGFALMQLEQYEPAIESFTKALEIDAKYINAITSRARAYLKLERFQEAIEDLDRAIELQPNQLQHYALRAEAYRASGQDLAAQADVDQVTWVTTLTDFNQKLQRNPRNADLWAAMGQHLLTRDRDEDARKSFDQGLNVNSKHLPSLMGRAQLSMRAGQPEVVVADCTTALEAGAGNEAHSLRGDAYLQLGKLDEAIADFNAAKRFDLGVAAAYRARAEQLRGKGDAALATKDEEFAARLEKSLTEAASRPTGAPRKMVVEQVSHEEPATAK